MHLEVRLEVEVRDLILVRNTEELRELRVGDDTALEVGVKAVVRLDLRRDELRDIRLRLEALDRETHERRELIRDRADLEEGVVRTARLLLGAVLRGERRGVNLALLARVTRLTLEGTRRLLSLTNDRTDTTRKLRVDRTERLLETREDRLRRTDLRGSRLNSGRDRRSSRRLRLRVLAGRLRGGSLNRGNRSRRGSRLLRHLVCLIRRNRGRHFERACCYTQYNRDLFKSQPIERAHNCEADGVWVLRISQNRHKKT